jgi:miniconductance mechanosensitive channel
MSFTNDPAIWLKELLVSAGVSYNLASILSTAGLVMIVILLSWLSNLIAKTIILKVVTKIVQRTASEWDDIFLEQKVFTRLSHFAPALVIWSMAGWALRMYPSWMLAVQNLTYVYMVVVGMVVVNSFIESWHRIYLTLPIAKHRHIKGYVQLVKIIVVLVAMLVIISAVFKKEVSTIIAGLGAMAAVMMLIFKDAILGLVASIQLSGNNMLKVGDWITIPSRGVDGNVQDITLTTVKVQNFDRTIITIPAYSLVNESFQNWKGMEESGIRQIKRSIFIDMRSIRFTGEELRERIRNSPALKKYFFLDEIELKIKNPERDETEIPILNDSGITNLGLFRFYAEAYLRSHPLINKNQALIVRHRQSEGNGLPLQVYAFCSNNSWIPFEHVQSEIFEHFIAILDEFGLKVFQQPTGDDLLSLSKQNDLTNV